MIFVTGASGLVGSHLIQSLIDKGLSVRAIYRKNIPDFRGSEKVEWIKGDILDVNSLHEAMQNVTHVYHCAAIVAFSPACCHYVTSQCGRHCKCGECMY